MDGGIGAPRRTVDWPGRRKRGRKRRGSQRDGANIGVRNGLWTGWLDSGRPVLVARERSRGLAGGAGGLWSVPGGLQVENQDSLKSAFAAARRFALRLAPVGPAALIGRLGRRAVPRRAPSSSSAPLDFTFSGSGFFGGP